MIMLTRHEEAIPSSDTVETYFQINSCPFLE